jgi:polar amino acid transport system substrate-binding protein
MKIALTLFFYLLLTFPQWTFAEQADLTLTCNEEKAKNALAQYQWLTEDYPPYNYKNKQQQLVGISTEILALVYKELAISFAAKQILMVPWARLYYNLENYSQYAAFTMMQTSARSHKFELVTLPIPTKVSIMVLADNKALMQAKSLAEFTIAVVRKDIGKQLLDHAGIAAKQVETTSASSMLKMLYHHRVDAIAYTETVAFFQLAKLGFNKNKLKTIYTLDNQSIPAYVFYKGTSQCVTQLFARTIAKLQQQGKLDAILRKYLSSLPIK